MGDHADLIEVLKSLYGDDKASEFEDEDLELLCRNKYKQKVHFQSSTRQSLEYIKLPARLIDIIHPPEVGGSEDLEEACLRAIKRAKREGSEGGSISISRVGTKHWALIQKTAKVKTKLCALADITAEAPSAPLPEPFEWHKEVADNKQSDRYIPHLEELFPLPDSLAWLKCGDNQEHLFDIQEPGMLHYDTIRGNTDMAIVSTVYKKFQAYSDGLHILFELKKQPDAQAHYQAMCQLLLANYCCSERKPVVVLTDLNDKWQLYWMDGTTITGGRCSSRAAAVMRVNQLVAEAAALAAHEDNMPTDIIANRNRIKMPGMARHSSASPLSLPDMYE
mmetsp:Transcript_28982/g.63939  ORF Transcript_28982/g.63939 Transcript_28982/m.63939 type:complete len:335 (+) Transcript_28982:257-1261(+)